MAEGRHAAPGDLVGERIAGRFVVEKLIGHGPLSTAFRAHDERLHRRVTVKLFHPQHEDDEHVVASQLEAASAVARLSHEHLAMVIDRGEHEGLPLVVLEYVRGENLAERIERYAPLAAPEVIGYATALAKALAYAHAEGVVHGNLRPENVLLTEERSVKLVDFGGGSYTAQLTGDPYIAPERRTLPPGAEAEPTDDIYALGVLVFVALTEQAPPVGGLDAAQLQMLRPDLSPRIAQAVAQAVAINPRDRQRSMRQFAADLSSGMPNVAAGAPDDIVDDISGETRAWTEDDAARLQLEALAPGWSGADVDEYSDEATDQAETGAVARANASGRRSRGLGSVRQVQVRQPRTARETSARILAWSMVVVPLLVLVLVGVMIAGERSSGTKRSEAGGVKQPTAERRVLVTEATSYDPFSPDDKDEHSELAGNVFDPSPDTTWDTSGYDTPDLSTKVGDHKGVGLVVRLERPADVRGIEIRTPLPGWEYQVYAAPEPTSDFDGWTPVSKVHNAENGKRVEVKLKGEPTDTLLIWITQLSLDLDETDKFRAKIGGIRVFEGG